MNLYYDRSLRLAALVSLSLLAAPFVGAQTPKLNRANPIVSRPKTPQYARSLPFPPATEAALAISLPTKLSSSNRSSEPANGLVKSTNKTVLAGSGPTIISPLPVKVSGAPAVGGKITPRDTVSPVVNRSGVPAALSVGKKSSLTTPLPRSAGGTLLPARSPVPVESEDQTVPVSQIDDTPLAGMSSENYNAHALRVPAIPIRDYNIVKSYYVELPYNKTISIIFPTPIKSVDLGSRDIIADKASDVENVLKVKASKVGFNETNYSVITTDGKFYSFVANYNEQPAMLALNLATNAMAAGEPGRMSGSRENSEEFINGLNPKDGTIQFSGIRATQSEVVYNCEQVNRRHRTIRHVGVSDNLMDATIRGFYVKDNVMYIKLQLKNKSNINYDLDYMRFFIVDKLAGKRSTFQETEIVPFYVHNDGIRMIPGRQKRDQVLAFQKFTIPDNKRILVQINEAGGGRALTFLMNNEDIMNSGKLN